MNNKKYVQTLCLKRIFQSILVFDEFIFNDKWEAREREREREQRIFLIKNYLKKNFSAENN
jgi:hypothetical protein